MDRYARSRDVLDLRKSRDLYTEAFEGARDDYYTGINAAAKNTLLGTDEDVARGRALAGQVEAIVGTEAKPGDYWRTATVAESQLIQRNFDVAGRRYEQAVAMAPKELGSHGATWKQACRLMRVLAPTTTQRALVRAAFAHLPDCDEVLAEES